MGAVSVGQITIVDNNDAKQVSLRITTNQAVQQIYSKDDNTVAYLPNFITDNLVLTPKVYVSSTGAATDISTSTVRLVNRKWSRNFGGTVICQQGSTAGTTPSVTQDTGSFVQADAAGTNVAAPFTTSADAITLTIKGNLKDSIGRYVITFEADYVDDATGLVSHIIDSIELSTVKTGTNAVFVQIRGKDFIEESNTGTKNSAVLCADLIRASGVDTNSLNYKWYNVTSGTPSQITSASTNYGFSHTGSSSVPLAVALGSNLPTATGHTYAATGTPTAGNTITISETAVNDYAVFRVDITDTAVSPNKTYSSYFTVYDISDPYAVVLDSSTGDKLQNGVGSTRIVPRVYNGASELSRTDLSEWVFTWVFYDRNGSRAGFVDVDASNTHLGTAYGATITAVTTTTISFTIPSGAATIKKNSNNIVKVVDTDGIARYYEITADSSVSTTTGVVTLSSAPVNISITDYPLPPTSKLVGGKLYVCTRNGTRVTTGVGTQAAPVGIVVTGEDIDVKGRITCEASRP